MMNFDELREKLTSDEAIGLTIFGEARNQSIEGKVAVGNVIRNRLRSNQNFGGKSYKDLCFAKNQFSCWWEIETNNYKELERATELVINRKSFNNSVLRECLFIGEGIANGLLRDNVNGALYYRTLNLYKEKPFTVKTSISLGDHVFYNL